MTPRTRKNHSYDYVPGLETVPYHLMVAVADVDDGKAVETAAAVVDVACVAATLGSGVASMRAADDWSMFQTHQPKSRFERIDSTHVTIKENRQEAKLT